MAMSKKQIKQLNNKKMLAAKIYFMENLTKGEALAKAENREKEFAEDLIKRRTITQRASKMFMETEMINYIKEMEDAEKEETILSIRSRKKILTEIAISKMERTSERLKAIDILNKMDVYNAEKEFKEEIITVELTEEEDD